MNLQEETSGSLIANWVPERPARLLLLAGFTGLTIGLGEVVLLGIQKFVLHRMIFQSPQVVWMAPLADLILFVSVTLGLLLLSTVWPRLRSLEVVLGLLAWLGALAILFMYPPLSKLAAALLAGGLAVQLVRIVRPRRESFLRLTRRSAPILAIITLCLALAVNARSLLSERRALARLPGPAIESAPNVLLIILDTVRAWNLSLYGYEKRTTPNLERLATRSVVFDRAISTAPWTLPSHASMFTGRWAHELSADWRVPLDDAELTLAEFLRSQGYLTAGFVANTGYCGWESGLDRGFIHYEDYRVSPELILASSSLVRVLTRSHGLRAIVGTDEYLARQDAEQINKDFLDWLTTRPERPFFAFLNYYDAHGPYMPPVPYDARFADGEPRGRISPLHRWNAAPTREGLSPRVLRQELAAYDGTIGYLDEQIGRLLARLDTEGVLDSTIVIIASDHGEEFGEHGLFDHGNSLYLAGLHVPLLISLPGPAARGERVEEPVSLRDLPATIVDLVGIPTDSPFPGRSLARYWSGSVSRSGAAPLLAEVSYAPNLPAWFPVSEGDMRSLFHGRFQYIRVGDGSEELYDVVADPLQVRNLVDDRRQVGVLPLMRTALQAVPTASP